MEQSHVIILRDALLASSSIYDLIRRLLFGSLFSLLCFSCSTPERPLVKWEEYIRSFCSKDSDSEVIGYVNEQGDIVLDTLYNPVLSNSIIYNVGAISSLNPKIGSFYINKEGKRFGRDSLWSFDFSYDTESEKFIRFSVGGYEKQTKRVGLFDWLGNVRLPAVYNWLSTVRNGLLTGSIGGKYYLDGEYWFTRGSRSILLDTTGSVLVDDSLEMKKMDSFIDFYSKRITAREEPGRINLKMKDGRYISFISYEHELKSYLNNKNIGDLLLDSILLEERLYSRSSFLTDPATEFARNKVMSLIRKCHMLNMGLADLPLGYYEESKVLHKEQETIVGEWRSYDFLKRFEEQSAADEKYRKFPVMEIYFDWNDYYATVVRTESGAYKLLQVITRGNTK